MSEEEPRETKIVGTAAVILARTSVKLEARTRAGFFIPHLLAADHFSRHVADVEQAHRGETFGEFFEEIIWFSSACVLSCSAGLEAYVNELFVDRSQHFPDLPPKVADKLWKLIERKPALEKFDMALLLKQKPVLNRDSHPTREICLLGVLRNALIHFKPEWDNKRGAHAELSKQLANKFVLSPFLPVRERIFPRRWATHGCTQWAVKSSLDFLTHFESLSGVVPAKMAPYASRLRG